MSWQQAQDKTMDCQIAPTLRVNWSQPRCWHGDTVTIKIRSAYVKDGGQITLEILVHGTTTVIDTIPLTLNANTLDHNYVVDWKTKVIPAGATSFDVKATLTTPATNATSDPMFVDLVVPAFSA